MPQNQELRLSREEMRGYGYRIIDQLVDHFENLPDKPVTNLAPRAQLEAQLREPLPEQGADFEQLLDLLQRCVWNNIGNTQHPRFFAFIPSPNNFISVLANTLVAGFNPFAGNWLEGSGPAEIELITIDWLRELCGLPETAGGHFVTGGSAANLEALAVASRVKLGDKIDDAVLYLSEQTHSSITRALRFLGFAREQVCTLPTNEHFRLRLDALRRAVRKDRMRGLRPFCVVANAGTTNTGAIDPLPELAEFCRAENLWLHVDGAYGAAAVLSERGRELLRGLELVDSLALDPHKWLFQPYEIGCVLVRDARLMHQTYQISAAYLADTKAAADEINYCDESMQLTREFRALKLWLSLKYFGAAAFRQAIERGLELAELTESILRKSPDWEVLSQATLGIVAFRYVRAGASAAQLNALNQQLVTACTKDGFAFVSSTLLNGCTALRMCTINPRTTDDDIRNSITRLTQLGQALSLEEIRNERSARQAGAGRGLSHAHPRRRAYARSR